MSTTEKKAKTALPLPMIKRRVGVKAKRHEAFNESLYRALRDYQERTIITNGTSVGALTQELTAVYDRVRDAARRLLPTEKSA